MSSNKKTLIDGDFQVGSAHFYVDVENNRVGLNQANPTSSLDVNGNAFIGTDMTVASNVTVGSNVIAQKFTGSAAGLTSVPADQISGVIPVENGGTGTTATTGTGSLVKSDNPTFTGTVTADTFSGSGASLTNIPMGQATGTLAVANGGTGVTTSTGTGNTVLSASPTLTGTVTAETGNFSSTVSASNIYAGYDTDMTSYLGRAAVGFSGISDEATFAHVDVNSTNNYALKQTATGGTYVNSATSKSTIFSINDSEQARINVTGLGVGTNDPLHKLDVHGTANVGALTCTTISGDGYLLSNVSGYSWPTHINGNDIYYTTGNVGIGTATPGNTLEVAGTASVPILKSAADAATSTYNYILNGPRPGTTSNGAVHFINGSTRTTDGGANTYTIRNNSGALRLGNVSYNTLLEGNVGIGVTDPGTALDVNGTVTATTFTGALSTSVTPGSYLTGSAYNGSTARTFAVDATTEATASKIVARNTSRDIFARLFRSDYQNQTTISGAMAYRISTTDNYIRFCSDGGAIRTFLNVPTRTGGNASGTWGISITGNADTVDGQHAHEMSWGHATVHATYTDFNTFINTDKFGAHYVKGTTNGPGQSGPTQYYHQRMSLGSEYNNYSLQLAIGRARTDNYLWYRNEENGSVSSWYKMRAGYADTCGNADTVDGLHSSSFFRRDASNDVDVRITAAHGRGVRFWDSDSYKIYMSSATDGTWGGRLDSSDYNMYFRMTSGTTRGFVFLNNRTVRCHINGNGDLYLNGGWLRTYGSAGWYSQSYGGGWFMQDTTYVRCYNDKTVYTGGAFLAGGNVTAYSDIRRKKDLLKIDNALDKVEQLTGYTYTNKKDNKRYTGLIAQDVEKVLPEAVATETDGHLSLAYGNMMGLLVEAVKELRRKNEILEARLNVIENNK